MKGTVKRNPKTEVNYPSKTYTASNEVRSDLYRGYGCGVFSRYTWSSYFKGTADLTTRRVVDSHKSCCQSCKAFHKLESKVTRKKAKGHSRRRRDRAGKAVQKKR